jgi:predicted  nucleic acid-binding Zn-ribbon protein
LKTILQNFSVASNGLKDERKVVQNKLNAIEQRIEKARDMFIEDKLDEEDFRSIKGKYKVEIENLKSKLNSIKKSSEENNNVEQKIDQSTKFNYKYFRKM